MTTPEQIRSRVREDKVDYILAQFVDIHGTPPRPSGAAAFFCSSFGRSAVRQTSAVQA